ncbi:Uncharacterised protein [uncultured archaeon]|nr:Uncharacterised protein [uncultured archaeon]
MSSVAFKPIFLSLLIAVFFSHLVSAQGIGDGKTNISVVILNEPPRVDWVKATDPFILSSNSSVGWCNITARDPNGGDDVVLDKILVWHKETSSESSPDNPEDHYTFKEAMVKDYRTVYRDLYVPFRLQGAAKPGEWICKGYVKDHENQSANGQTNFTVITASCYNNYLNEGEELTDCGGPCAACLIATPAYIEGNIGSEVNATENLTTNIKTPHIITEYQITDLTSQAGTIPSQNIRILPANISVPGNETKTYFPIIYVNLRPAAAGAGGSGGGAVLREPTGAASVHHYFFAGHCSFWGVGGSGYWGDGAANCLGVWVWVRVLSFLVIVWIVVPVGGVIVSSVVLLSFLPLKSLGVALHQRVVEVFWRNTGSVTVK